MTENEPPFRGVGGQKPTENEPPFRGVGGQKPAENEPLFKVDGALNSKLKICVNFPWSK